jgi:hypothetical protein
MAKDETNSPSNRGETYTGSIAKPEEVKKPIKKNIKKENK